MLVSILADGVPVNPQTVVNGTVTLEQPATAIVIGLGFTAQLQTMYLDIPGPVTVQGRRKFINQVITRVANSGLPFDIGVNQIDASTTQNQVTVPWTNMTGVQGAVQTAQTPIQPYGLNTGDFWGNVFDQAGQTNGQIAVQQTLPLPLTVLAVLPYSVVDEPPG
jgi:hypothetical protein